MLTNDYSRILPGSEAVTWVHAQEAMLPGEVPPTSISKVLDILYSKIYVASEGQLFLMRLPGILVLVAGLLISLVLLQPLFGKKSLEDWLVVGAATPGVIFVAKVASADVWCMVFGLLHFTLVLRNLKTPGHLWTFLSLASLLAGIMVAPLESLLFALVLRVSIRFLHPNAGRLPWWDLVAGILFLGLLSLTDWVPFFSDQQFFQVLNPLGYGVLLVGLMFWLPFFLIGIWDNYFKIRKKEELSILLLSPLLAAFFAQHPVFFPLSALLVTKQLHASQKKAYPWNKGLKVLHILLILVLFFMGLMLMMGGFTVMRGAGFRAGMAVAAVTWSTSFIAVIGLYGKRFTWTKYGLTGAGLLGVFFYLVMAHPLLNHLYNWPEKIVTSITSETDQLYYGDGLLADRLDWKVGVKEKNPDIKLTKSAKMPGLLISSEQWATQKCDTLPIYGFSFLPTDSLIICE